MPLSNIKPNTLKYPLKIMASTVLVSSALFLILEYYFNIIKMSITEMAVLSIVVIVASYVKLFCTEGYYKLGFHMIILTYTLLSHFGAIIAYSINAEESFIRSNYSMRFMYMPELETAFTIALFTCIVFVLSVSKIKTNTNTIQFSSASRQDNTGSKKVEAAVFIIGIIIQAIGVFLLLSLIRNGYLNIQYTERNKAMNSLPWYGHYMILLSYAFCLMLAMLPFKKWKYGLVFFGVTSILHFILGNRGEVLYSALCCVAVYYLKYKKISLKWILLGIFGLVFIIPLIRDFRVLSAISDYSLSLKQNIIELLSELGFQIAPFTYTVQIVQAGSGYQFGGTYLYGLADFLLRKVPILPQLSADNVLNIRYIMPQTGLGFTHIGEAYYNFGFLGAGIYYYIFSKFLLKLEQMYTNSRSSEYKRIFCALIVVEFVNLTRNNSATFPVYFSYIFVLMGAIYLISHLKKDRKLNI